MSPDRRKALTSLAACFGVGVASACVLIGVISQTVEGPTFAVEVDNTTLPVAAESITTRVQPVSPFEGVPVQRPEVLETQKAEQAQAATETSAPAAKKAEPVWKPDDVPPAALFAASRPYVEPWRGQWSPDDVGPPIQRPSSLRAPRWNPNVALPPL